jgi:hypothetical protein
MTPDQTANCIAVRFVTGEYAGQANLAMHISSAIQQAIREERERCAKIAELYASRAAAVIRSTDTFDASTVTFQPASNEPPQRVTKRPRNTR